MWSPFTIQIDMRSRQILTPLFINLSHHVSGQSTHLASRICKQRLCKRFCKWCDNRIAYKFINRYRFLVTTIFQIPNTCRYANLQTSLQIYVHHGFPAIFYCDLLLKSSRNEKKYIYQMLVVVHKEIWK